MSRGALHHIEINVSDLQASVAFWGWFLARLGYMPHQQWAQGRSWKLGECYIVLCQTRDAYTDMPYHRCRTGLNHLAFHADSCRDVDEMADALRNRGVTVLYEDRHPHAGGADHYAVFFEDPDRIKVEFAAPPGKELKGRHK